MQQNISEINYLSKGNHILNKQCQSDILKSILKLELLFDNAHINAKNRIALFDLDNTLLVGDIVEAVFAQLLNSGLKLPLKLKQYRELCTIDPFAAYIEIVRALDGLSTKLVSQVKKIFCSRKINTSIVKEN